jgi:hypothetical protein
MAEEAGQQQSTRQSQNAQTEQRPLYAAIGGEDMSVYVRNAVEKRRETIAARKNDTGCECHGKPLLECPDYKPQVWRSRINKNY